MTYCKCNVCQENFHPFWVLLHQHLSRCPVCGSQDVQDISKLTFLNSLNKTLKDFDQRLTQLEETNE